MRKTVLAFLGLGIAILAATGGSAQIQANADCVAAQTWHLQQAMKVNLQNEQEYHLGAAEAADQLSNMGGAPCANWKGWADGSIGSVAP